MARGYNTFAIEVLDADGVLMGSFNNSNTENFHENDMDDDEKRSYAAVQNMPLYLSFEGYNPSEITFEMTWRKFHDEDDLASNDQSHGSGPYLESTVGVFRTGEWEP